MNVYDFDETIFHPDCTLKFAAWCMKKNPGLAFSYLPKVFSAVIAYKFGKADRYKVDLASFSFLKSVKDFDREIECFWDENEKNISAWYLAQKRPDDLIISASPECVVKPIADRLGVRVVATKYDREYGVLYGNLMLAQSKSRYIIENGFPFIENFYSDSLSDTPLALCAEHAYLVTKKATTPVPWPKLDREVLEKVHRKIDTGWKRIGED